MLTTMTAKKIAANFKNGLVFLGKWNKVSSGITEGVNLGIVQCVTYAKSKPRQVGGGKQCREIFIATSRSNCSVECMLVGPPDSYYLFIGIYCYVTTKTEARA